MAIADTFSNLGTAIINYVNRKTGPATTSKLGQVKPDGTTITVDANGVISAGSGGGHIGEIVKSLTPLNEAGLHLLDGSVIANGSYAQFVSHMASLYASNPSLFVTESEWQASTSTYGVCGKFVYDSAKKTVRLPKVTGIIEGTTDLSALGDLIEAGLPNITANWNSAQYDGGWGTPEGAVYGVKNNSPEYNSGSSGMRAYFDASRSSSIYGKSNTVQPQTIKVLYYIVIAQSAKTELQVNIDNIATDLNNKVSKSDLLEVQCVVETYVNGTSWYRVYSDGWCEQGGRVSAASQTVTFLKAFANTSYCITGGLIPGNSAASYEHLNIGSLTTTSFYYTSYDGYQLMWQAAGYLV